MRTLTLISTIIALAFSAGAQTSSDICANAPREFRGAWMSTVFQEQWSRQTTAQNKEYIRSQLDELKRTGCNAVIFQVRPQADAFYPSQIEPWSRHLTGAAGRAPNPTWDPLSFIISEAHARGMELHAWLNPYRVTTTAKETLPKGHIYHQHPERFIKYGGKIYFDPALQENRDFIARVVADIVTRYDIDAIHFDDYFYPYPVKGTPFPDDKSYRKFGKGMNRGDWRRHNVDLLIEQIHNTIASIKPWVRFGISPFGIWRNKTSDPDGSDTGGLQNYDDLYADVLLWARKGWIDYLMPQLYWQLEHKIASTITLAHWWNSHSCGRRLYFGQDVEKSMDYADIGGSGDKSQLAHKIALSRELPNVHGNCWWPAYSLTKNYKGVADMLASKYQAQPALPPNYPWLDSIPPEPPIKVVATQSGKATTLTWRTTYTEDPLQQPHLFAIFRDGLLLDITDARSYTDLDAPKGKHTYAVATLDRTNNISSPAIAAPSGSR